MTTFLDSSARTEAPEKQYNFSFFAFMAALVLVFAASMAALVVSDYRRTVERAEQQLDHVADLFRQTVDASLSVANAKMQNTVEQLVQEPLGDRAAIAARFDDLLKDTVADIRQIDSLVLIDPQGEVAWSTTESLYGVNLADRSYFQKARQFGNGIYTIGVPILSRANGRRLTPIAWPLRAADGTLLGVVASSLGETYFSGLLTLNQLGEEMRVSITASNGEVAFVSEEVNATPRPMLSATKVISPIGLQIEASTSQAAALEPFWQRTVAVSLLASLLFLAAIAAAVSARTRSVELAGALRRSEHDRRRVEAAQKEFDTIFENVGDGIVLFDDGDTLIRSNLRARHLLGAETHEEAVARMRSLLPPLSRMDTATEVHRLSLPVPGSPDQ